MDALLRLTSMDGYSPRTPKPEGSPCGLTDDELKTMLHAMLAPWADLDLKEGYLLPAADAVATVERVLNGLPVLEMPSGYYGMKWDDMTALADPFWQRAYEWGWPPDASPYQPPLGATVTT